MDSSQDRGTSFEEAVRSMQALKAEHRTLLERIAEDEGMSAETRRMLVTHVLEEEDERLSGLLSLTCEGDKGTDAPEARLTVGSLRQDPPASPPHRGTIGSLRREEP